MITAAPGLFVVLWSTGFIGAKLGLPYAEPFTFLALRYALVSAALFVVLLAAGSPWPRSLADVFHTVVAGLLLHGVYLGGVFSSIHLDLEAGVAALIVGVQPLLTAALAVPLVGERVNRTQVAGLLLGLAGVTLVVWKLFDERLSTLALTGMAIAVAGVALVNFSERANALFRR